MSARGLKGVFAAVPTPVDAGGEPDLGRFLLHARWALANGCDGLNVLGTTGEATSFSTRQRLAVMNAAAGGLDPARLMVGTGAPDIQTTVDLTRAAEQAGFAGALVLPPFYYKAVADDALFEWFARLATATRRIAIHLYNFPQMTGIRLSPDLARRLKQAFGSRIAGAKDSSGDLAYAAELAKIPRFAVFPSDEGSLSLAGKHRFAGCISATVNLTAPLAARLWRDPGNEALGAEVRAMRQAIAAHPMIPAVKYLLARLHGDGGFERVQPPHLPLDGAAKRALARIPGCGSRELRGIGGR